MPEVLEPELLHEILTFQTELGTAYPDLELLMSFTVRRVRELSQVDGVVIELVEGQELVYRAVGGLASPQLGLRLRLDRSFSGLSVSTATTLLCENAFVDHRVDSQACHAIGSGSLAVSPLLREGLPVGALKLLNSAPGSMGSRHLAILKLIAPLVGGVFENAMRWAKVRAQKELLTHLASHDRLTGLRNRSAFYDHFRQALANSRRAWTRVGVVLLDLDDLKGVNDTFGHPAGDFLLVSFGQKLVASLRDADVVARLGGDEFGVIIAPIEDGIAITALAQHLVARTESTVRFGDAEFSIRTSFGVAVAPDDGVELETLIARADERLYIDKRQRKARQIL